MPFFNKDQGFSGERTVESRAQTDPALRPRELWGRPRLRLRLRPRPFLYNSMGALFGPGPGVFCIVPCSYWEVGTSNSSNSN